MLSGSGAGRKKWSADHASWRLLWGEAGSFSVDHVGDGLNDSRMEDWVAFMDAQIEKRFGFDNKPALTATTLNFARNDLGDAGIQKLVEYLLMRKIGVQVLKLFKNNISDGGAFAIANLLAHAREPLLEIHLSHNSVTEQGACAMFEAVAQSERYPFVMERAGRRDSQPLIPVWLRMEYNCIQWSAIENRLIQQQVRWCTADIRDARTWAADQTPMISMHSSYKIQKLDNFGSTPLAGQAVDDNANMEPGANEVPLYAFLDASAVKRFAAERASAKDKMFTFQGLLNLCQQGHMKCTPPSESHSPSWLGPVAERDRIILVVTDNVLEELAQNDPEQSPTQRSQLNALREDPDSHLQICHRWGILEVLETKLHTNLIKLSGWEQRAQQLNISQHALRSLDFACLWEGEIEATGRVIFVTADEAVCTFMSEARACVESLNRVVTMHANDLDRIFADDREYGGHRLYEAAQKVKSNKFCGAVLCAQMLHTLVISPALQILDKGAMISPLTGEVVVDADMTRAALVEAMHLLMEVRPLLAGKSSEAASCVQRIDEATNRWQALLGQTTPTQVQ